jgi:tetratricopeptide (TPR) repeat protein
LTDVGLVCIREGDYQRALHYLEEALTMARALHDKALEIDVLNQLGLAARGAGELQRAIKLLEPALCAARAAHDRFAEKTALFHLGLTFTTMNMAERALTYFQDALTVARALGDRRHIVELLWYMSIRYAELGRSEQAEAHAREAISLLREKGDPQADWFEHHLHKYANGNSTALLDSAPRTDFDGAFLATSFNNAEVQHPGFLRMAFTAAGSMATFLGSGFKGATEATYRQRLDTCATCAHHTGLRCRLCGCFTNLKAWMPHEECPVGKWP